MFIRKILSLILLSGIGIGLVACGAGFEIPPLRPQGNLSGTIGDEAVQGAIVRVFTVHDGGKGELLGETTVADDGSYSLDIRAKTQPILIELSAGVYRESASGKIVELAEGINLRAMAVYTSGEPLTITISPVTHIATALALFENAEGKDLTAAVTESHALLDQVFNFDVFKTHPLPIGKVLETPDELKPETIFGFYLAAISSWTSWVSKEHELEPHNVYNTPGLSQILYDDVLADGLLNGRGVSSENGQAMDLFYGKIGLDANVYRISFAQHMLAIAGSPENKTTISAKRLLDVAHELATSQHPFYGDRELGEFTEQAPTVYALESENNYQNGTFHFAVALSSVVGAETVEFFVDDESLGTADDTRKPFVDINTELYEDGEHKIVVVTRNVFEKSNTTSFDFRFDNSGPVVNVASPLVTNQQRYKLSGTYSDSGAGVKTLSVYGVDVALGEDGNWDTEFVLGAGKNSVPIVIMDLLDNPTKREVVIALDQTAPVIDTTGGHSKALIVVGAEIDEKELSDDNSYAPLLIETNKISLKGAGINRQSLDVNKIPYFAFSVSDPKENDVSSSFEEIDVFFTYKINDKTISNSEELSPVGNEYLVPLVTEGLQLSEELHSEWYKASPLDEHIIDIEVKDVAGNVKNHEFRFRTDFRVPEIVIPETDIEQVNRDVFSQYSGNGFVNRSELNNQTVSTLRYKYANDKGAAVYIKVDDDTQHSVVRRYDAAVRVNKVTWTLTTEWRLRKILNVLDPNSCPEDDRTIDDLPIYYNVTELANYKKDGGWASEIVPAAEISEALDVASDNPKNFETDWVEFHFNDEFNYRYERDIPNFDGKNLQIRYSYDYLHDITKLYEPSAVVGWVLEEVNADGSTVVIKNCSNVSYLEGRVLFSDPIQVDGYPRNELLGGPLFETIPFSTSGFFVEDIEEGKITPVDGWYRIPMGHVVWIYKQVITPGLVNYTNNEVIDDIESISSYQPVKFDSNISWQVNRQLKVDVIHDAGEENINNMTIMSLNAGEGVSTFTINR